MAGARSRFDGGETRDVQMPTANRSPPAHTAKLTMATPATVPSRVPTPAASSTVLERGRDHTDRAGVVCCRHVPYHVATTGGQAAPSDAMPSPPRPEGSREGEGG